MIGYGGAVVMSVQEEVPMKKKSIILAAVVAVLAIAGVLIYRVALAKATPTFRFVTIDKGNMQSTVSATGTLGAVTTVSVGTQVSGQVSALLVDFNDHVTKGQLLARIDPTLAQQAVADAQANVEKAQAQMLQASRDFARNKELATAGLVARSALDITQSTNSVAAADVTSAKVALDRAKQNLSYTSIYSPIDGVVVERNVQLGQTVAASLSAPQLFLIANDLAHMQILAQVGESDIAQIKEGQPVQFAVQALPGKKFNATVQQVRLQSTTADNVVNYTVVVQVENPDNQLLPGMTARVDFLTKSATDILKVSNAALRFHPSDELLAQLGQKPASTTTAAATSTARAPATSSQGQPSGTRTRGTGQGNGSSSSGTLYYLDAKGQIQSMKVRTGITDGTSTEVQGKGLTTGMKVIAGATTTSTQTASTSTTAAPFGTSTQQQRGGGGRPGGGF
jgi:HlyD family secretion protein